MGTNNKPAEVTADDRADSSILTSQMGLFEYRDQFAVLDQRKLPVGAGFHLEPLLSWCTPQRRNKPMPSVADCSLPAIYAEHFNGGTRLVSAHDAPRHATARFELASTVLDEDGVASQPARLLTPQHLIVLSQVLALLRHANTDEASVMATDDRSIAIAFRARYLLQRAGLVKGQFYGAAYDRLEKILSDLALLRIKYSERDESGEWQNRSHGGFFDIFSSGGARDVFKCQRSPSPGMALRQHSYQGRYRDTQWKVLLSEPMARLLSAADTSNVTAVLPSLQAITRRSSSCQWLALYYSGHGYDNGTIFDRRLDTLCRQMYPDVGFASGSDATDADKKGLRSSLAGFRARLDQHAKSAMPPYAYLARLSNALKRLFHAGFFEQFNIIAGTDLPADLRSRSRRCQPGDRVRVTRHPALIEQSLSALSPLDRKSRWFSLLQSALKRVQNDAEKIHARVAALLKMPRRGVFAQSMLARLALAMGSPGSAKYYGFRSYPRDPSPPLILL